MSEITIMSLTSIVGSSSDQEYDVLPVTFFGVGNLILVAAHVMELYA